MSAFDMHPKFGTLAEYRSWRKSWAILFKTHVQRIRKMKNDRAALQQRIALGEKSFGVPADSRARLATIQRELVIERAMGHKMMTLLDDAKARANRIREMQKALDEQMKSFPMTIESPSFDFHFNRGAIEFPFLPMWTLKTRGKTYYIQHLDASGVVMTTRETPEHPSTKGAIRFRRGRLTLNPDGTATLVSVQAVENALAA